MKFLMNYVLTRTEKIVLLFLAVLAILGLWYAKIYHPLELRIQAADTTAIENELALEQVKAMKIQEMQTEIAKNQAAGLPIVPTYNNFKEVADELNLIFGNAYDFDFQFSEPETTDTTVRRNVTVTFRAKDYDTATAMMTQILNGAFRTMIHDVSFSSSSRTDADHVDNVITDEVSVTFLMTDYETTYDADTAEGLTTKTEQKKPAGGLAGADVSNLERSDLETAAEAVLEE